MSKRPTGLVYIGNIINYFLYLYALFSRGLEVNLEGRSTFLTLMPLMHINGIGLISNLYGCLFKHITMYQDSWAGAAALYMEVGWCYTIAVSA